MLLSCSSGKDSWESLGQQGHQINQSYRKSTLDIHWKNWCWNWSWSSSILATWCQRADSLERTLMLGKIEGRRRRWGGQRIRWLDGIIDSMDMNLHKTPGDSGGQGPGMLELMGWQSWIQLINWITANLSQGASLGAQMVKKLPAMREHFIGIYWELFSKNQMEILNQ